VNPDQWTISQNKSAVIGPEAPDVPMRIDQSAANRRVIDKALDGRECLILETATELIFNV
jgi:hypothetical protein